MTRSAVELLADRLAINDVLLAYFRGLDRRDFETVRACFSDDAHLRYGEHFDGGREAFIDWVASEDVISGHDRTVHFAGNVYIDLAGDAADTEVYAMAFHDPPVEHRWQGRFVTMWLRYLDRVERRPEGWRIVRRDCVVDWVRHDRRQSS